MATYSSILTGESHGQRSLEGCSPWGHKESDTTEQLHFQAHVRLSPGGGNGTNILTWRIPWTEEPGGLQSMGSR